VSAAIEAAASEAPPSTSGGGGDIRSREMSVALRNGLKMGGSLLITWTVAMIVKFDVPRYLGPVRQGHFGFSESFATMFFSMLSLGVETHIIKEVAVRPRYASEVVGGVFAVRGVLSVVLLFAMGITLWATGRQGDVFGAAMIFGATQILMSLNGTYGAVLQAISRVEPSVVANVLTKLVWGVGLLLALHFRAPLWLLAIPALAAEALRLAILAPSSGRLAKLQYRIDIPEVRKALAESVPYFVNGLALGILNGLGMSVLEYIRKDEREVGWFAADQNLGYLCMLLSPILFWVVMPLLSRAQARSKEEAIQVFRRCLEGIVIAIIPVTVLISAGADILVRFAFRAEYLPAATGLSILSLVFIMTYMNMMFAMNLIVTGRGWSVTVISICSVFVSATLNLLLVPLGRHLLGEGGECAGAAASVIGSEAFVVIAMLTRFETLPLDARNIATGGSSVAIGALILILNHYIRGLGPVRLVIEGLLYVVLAFALRVVRVRELAHVVSLVRKRGEPVVVV
jgi:O-antigen/teichoic acid export membrane protein